MRVGKNQRQADDDILHQTLRAEADGQSDDGGAGQIIFEAHAKFLKHQSKRKEIHDERHAAGDELDERDELGLVRDKAERVFLNVALVDEPFRDVPDGLDRHVQQDDERDDEQQARAGGRFVGGEEMKEALHHRRTRFGRC
jgi:hypothetical protein